MLGVHLLSVFVVTALLQCTLALEDVVTTKFGKVRGLVFPTYRRFQGVPFAMPPLGALRWKNPIDPGLWYTTLDCRNFTIGCAQSAHSLDVPKNTSEDCLYLELWTPRVGKYSQPAAVMVFFYGGDFKEGGESFQIYNGRYLASTTNTIVVVTNYRIGNLGFLYAPFADPNVGIEDQRFTLKWVKNNIAGFGGDPSKVMIFGESAGGESILIHLSSPKASGGLFTSALAESGPMSLNFKNTQQAALLADVFAYHLGCFFEDQSCYLNKTTKEVLDAAGKSFVIPTDISMAVMQWAPVVVGDSLPQEPAQAFINGNIIKVPIAVGSNLNDGVLFGYAIANGGTMYSPEYMAIVEGIFFGTGMVEAILLQYPPVFFGDNSAVLSKLLTDYCFGCSGRQTLRWAEAAGVKQTYLYQFTQQPPFCFWPKHQQFCCDKVCHGDELPYVFTDTGAPFPWNLTGNDLAVSEAMAVKWASFARFGDPNMLPSKVTWPAYRTATNISMNFGQPLGPVSNLDGLLCDFWDSVGYLHTARSFVMQAETILRDFRAKQKKEKSLSTKNLRSKKH